MLLSDRSLGQTETTTNEAIHSHTLQPTHEHITCKLAVVLGFWLLAIQHQAFLHFFRLGQHSWGEHEERRFPNIWQITFQEEKTVLNSCAVCQSSAFMCVPELNSFHYRFLFHFT